MSAIVPPLDFIPKLPGKAVSEIMKRLDLQTDRLATQVTKTVENSVKLPANVNCDDPRVKKIKDQLTEIQNQITQVQQEIPRIQSTIETVKQVVAVAQGIKTAITIGQLSVPLTAGVFIANQLIAIQDATIVNAIESLNQFSTIPASLTSKLSTIVPPLTNAISKISATCGETSTDFELPSELLNNNTTANEDYNDLVPTEFYNEENVSESDLQDRSNTIEQLLTQQRDLLTSLQEAPSKVYQQPGVPAGQVGKIGDYYIDTQSSKIYGPKPSLTEWGQPVNL
jgi:predicted  nucleic acid-binding Zn-ribbon protein